MKFKANEVREPMHVTIRGDETWLAFLYQSFRQAGLEGGPRLTGEFTLTPQEYGLYSLKGYLRFTPQVECGRCQESIPWEIEREIDARFLTPHAPEDFDDGQELEVDLVPEDLDTYYIEAGTIDVEIVINDLVQTALPQRLLKITEDGKACAICFADLQQQVVFEDPNNGEVSPFAVLKNLKLPEN